MPNARLFIITLTLTCGAMTTIQGAFASTLAVTTSSTPGSTCYEGSNLVLVSCYQSVLSDEIQGLEQCEKNLDYTGDMSECYVGSSNGFEYYCTENNAACDFCAKDLEKNYGPWTTVAGDTRSFRTISMVEAIPNKNNRFICEGQPKEDREWGCAQGYYQSGGNGEDITCVACPPLGDGENKLTTTNATGETNKSTCCASAETVFKDPRGSGKLKSKCCHSNK